MSNESEIDHLGNVDNNARLEAIVIINCALNAILMPISITGNTLLLAAVFKTPSLRSPSIVFLCSLAVSDLLAGLVVQPVYIANELTSGLIWYIRNTSAFCICAVSLSTMTAISVDRFLALHYHMRYPDLMTTHRAIYTSGALWLISFLLALSNLKESALYFTVATSIVICLISSTICYFGIFRIVRQHQLQIHVQQQVVESFDAEHNQNILQSNKSAINTFIYYIAMILCYTPLFIAMLTKSISRIQLRNWWTLTETAAFINSFVNPFLYCWRIGQLRRAVAKTARQMLCIQTENN